MYKCILSYVSNNNTCTIMHTNTTYCLFAQTKDNVNHIALEVQQWCVL